MRQAHDKRREDSESSSAPAHSSSAAAAPVISADGNSADSALTQPDGNSDGALSHSNGANVYRLAPSLAPEVTSNGHSVPGIVSENGALKVGAAAAARPNVSANCYRRAALVRQRRFIC